MTESKCVQSSPIPRYLAKGGLTFSSSESVSESKRCPWSCVSGSLGERDKGDMGGGGFLSTSTFSGAWRLGQDGTGLAAVLGGFHSLRSKVPHILARCKDTTLPGTFSGATWNQWWKTRIQSRYNMGYFSVNTHKRQFSPPRPTRVVYHCNDVMMSAMASQITGV